MTRSHRVCHSPRPPVRNYQKSRTAAVAIYLAFNICTSVVIAFLRLPLWFWLPSLAVATLFLRLRLAKLKRILSDADPSYRNDSIFGEATISRFDLGQGCVGGQVDADELSNQSFGGTEPFEAVESGTSIAEQVALPRRARRSNKRRRGVIQRRDVLQEQLDGLSLRGDGFADSNFENFDMLDGRQEGPPVPFDQDMDFFGPVFDDQWFQPEYLGGDAESPRRHYNGFHHQRRVT